MTRILYLFILFLMFGCSSGEEREVYMGRIEAETTVVSAQAAGELLEFELNEGDRIERGQILARIDSEQQEIQKKQQLARMRELDSQKKTALLRIEQSRATLELTRDTLEKTEKLLLQGGATEQKRDELAVQLKVSETELAILQAQYDLILAQEEELRSGLELIDLSIEKASVPSPVSGTVLTRYHNRGELVGIGTPLLDAADLDTMDVYIYVPLRTLAAIPLGRTARITAAGAEDPYEGTVVWIASEGEFTPKTILTGETRDTLVYEVKLRVGNSSGELKIGMPVDVVFP